MPNIRELTNRINILGNMQKVMDAMNKISSAKLTKHLSVLPALDFFEKAVAQTGGFAASALQTDDQLYVRPGQEPVASGVLIMFSGDKGLCGAHNSSVFRKAAAMLEQKKKEGSSMDVLCAGLKGLGFCGNKEYTVEQSFSVNALMNTPADLRPVARELSVRMNRNELKEIWIVYNRFISILRQETESVRVLPLHDYSEQAGSRAADIPIEPSVPEMIPLYRELYLYFYLRAALLNSYISEQASRMNAMDNAAHNSRDLINRYMTLRNRARQNMITNDLIEIIAGKEAMER